MDIDKVVDDLLNVDLDYLMEDIISIARTLDRNYKEKPANFHMKYVQYTHLSLENILLADLINWLCALGYSDGDFSIVEVEFIKRYLRLDISSLEIIDFAQKSIVSGFLDRLPESIALLMEDDMVMNMIAEEIGRAERQNFADRLFFVFQVLGIHFIICDGNIDEGEKRVFIGFTEQIRELMEGFDVLFFSDLYHQKLKDEIGFY